MTSYPIDLSGYGLASHWRHSAAVPRRLLFVLAHPDDESFGNAGTIARYSSDGAGVHYACATRGECGGVAPELLNGYPDIAALRSAELAEAANALDMASYHFLGYRDSGMAGWPENDHPQALIQAGIDEVAGRVTAAIRAIRPQVVVTFNTYGGYGHPDHIAIHKAALLAFERAGDPAAYPEQIAGGLAAWQPSKLYYPTSGTAMLRLALRTMRLLGKDPRKAGDNGDIDFVRMVDETTPVTARIACGAFMVQRDAAWRAHRSQLGGMGGILRLPRALRRPFSGAESFTRIVPPANGGLEQDLFEGI